MPLWLRDGLIPLAAGALAVLALAPWNWWWLMPLSQCALAALWMAYPSHCARTGFAYGLGFFGAGTSWVYVSIHIHGHAPPLLAGFLTALFCLGLACLFALQGGFFRWWLRPGTTWRAIGFAAIWVAFEWLRSWLLTGFPWLYAGYATLDTPLAGWASTVGVLGSSAILALWAAGLTAAVTAADKAKGLACWTLLTVALLGGGAALGQVEWTRPNGEPLRVALYQPNIPLAQKWDRRRFTDIIAQYNKSVADTVTDVDLVVWPESAIPAFRHQVTGWLNGIEKIFNQNETGLITGIPTRAGEVRYNSIIGLAAASGEYHKQKLVPFGEYVPLESLLRGLIGFFDLPMSQFSSGPSGQRPLQLGEHYIAPFICYEIVYPAFVARGARDADLLVTISNDSWFGHSIGPLQHFQMARYRALETGRELLRGTNNGVTAIIDHRGRIRQRLTQFTEGSLVGEMTPRTGDTPYMLAGNYPVLTMVLLGLMVSRTRHVKR